MDNLRDPIFAACVAAALTAGYLYMKARMNNETALTTSAFAKPAILNGIMVYLIVSYGMAKKERIMTDPF
jgi:hypothetical protein